LENRFAGSTNLSGIGPVQIRRAPKYGAFDLVRPTLILCPQRDSNPRCRLESANSGLFATSLDLALSVENCCD
jgi:hypothetical protein